jgi:hypothetical protein
LQAAFRSAPVISSPVIGKPYSLIGDIAMKKVIAAAFFALILLILSASAGFAQVKRVEMKIDGYLCGN